MEDSMKKFLVVDDSSTMRRIVTNTLARLNYKEVTQAEDGLDAWEKLQQMDTVSAILTDWNMPNLDGLGFVKKVRADKKYDDVPIVMITTEGGKTEVITALKAGVNNYVVKPFTPQVLKEKLSDLFGEND
jgi:two-component system chemotaxis response regulator CheY